MVSLRLRRGILLCIGWALVATSAARAADVTYTLEIKKHLGTWQLFGEASLDDNFGLALVSIPLENVEFPVDLQLPLAHSTMVNLNVQGFISGRVDDPSPIGGSQDTLTPTNLVYGFGQSAGMLNLGDVFVQQSYDAKLLIAQGTYDPLGSLPEFGNGGSATVFTSMGGTGVDTAALHFATDVIPEPSSGLLVLMGLVCMGSRRGREAFGHC